MEPVTSPRVKVCCIASIEEARTAIRAGASALGLVSAMPSGPGVIAEEQIAEIAGRVPPGVDAFLLTSLRDAESILAQERRLRASVIQIVDRPEPGTHAALRRELPGVRIVQVIHVEGPDSVDEALCAARHVDAILLDSGRPNAAIKELGGTGRTHDWRLSRRIREALPVPMYLAGGLTPENAADAVREVGPFGLDVCTGVRTKGDLDAGKLRRLLEAVRTA